MPVGDDVAQGTEEDGSDEHCDDLGYADAPDAIFGSGD